MTNFKGYISNVSRLWPIPRQEAVFAAENLEAAYRDILDASERRGYRLNGLSERDTLFRSTTRGGEKIVGVASFACFARNADDLVLALSKAADVGITIRDLSAKISIKPDAKAKDLKKAVEAFNEARKREKEFVRGQTGGKKSAELRTALAKNTALKYEQDWRDSKKTSRQISNESGLSVNTLKAHLGGRVQAKRNFIAALKRGKGAWDNRSKPEAVKEVPYVYLAKRQDGVYKIGFSANPMKRMKDLQAQFRKRFRLAKTWQRKDAFRVEKFAHKLLREKLHLGSEGWETFKAPRKVLVAAIEEAIKQCEET